MVPYQDQGPVDCSIPIDLSKVEGKTAIVTGGSSGLGEAIAKAFADAGAFVVIADLREPKTPPPSNVIFVQCDVLSWEQQLAVFKSAIAKSPAHRVDIVTTCAGLSGPDYFHDLDTDEPVKPEMRILQVNLIGTVYTSKLALHYFKKQGAGNEHSLILIASDKGFINTSGSPTYSASKFGVRGLMGCLRRFGCGRVNLLAPWYVATPLMSEAVMERLHVDMAREGTEFAKIEDVAKGALRLASDKSINGRSLFICPRNISENGYMDLDLDDFKEGSLMHKLQKICNGFTHRKLPADQQAIGS